MVFQQGERGTLRMRVKLFALGAVVLLLSISLSVFATSPQTTQYVPDEAVGLSNTISADDQTADNQPVAAMVATMVTPEESYTPFFTPVQLFTISGIILILGGIVVFKKHYVIEK